MDKCFMSSFYEKYYINPQEEAVGDSNDYIRKKNLRYEIENKLVEQLKGLDEKILFMFEEYLDACADEQEVLLLRMYLLGAEDREKMLRGII